MKLLTNGHTGHHQYREEARKVLASIVNRYYDTDRQYHFTRLWANCFNYRGLTDFLETPGSRKDDPDWVRFFELLELFWAAQTHAVYCQNATWLANWKPSTPRKTHQSYIWWNGLEYVTEREPIQWRS